jgi:hypothetical protein
MDIENRPKMPRAQIIYGEIIYWITVLACLVCMIGPVIALAFPKRNILNPYRLFDAIFAGKSAGEIWQELGAGIQGGHFYLKHFLYGDGFTQFGLALGCSVALWALIGAVIMYLREKQYIYAGLGIWVSFLVLLSMIGIVGAGH